MTQAKLKQTLMGLTGSEDGIRFESFLLLNLYLKYYSLINNGAVLLLISNNYSNLLDAILQIELLESDQLTEYGISPKKLADSLHQLSPGIE